MEGMTQANSRHYTPLTKAFIILFLTKNSQAVKYCGPHKSHCGKRCGIQGGRQEMAEIVGKQQNFNSVNLVPYHEKKATQL